MGAWHSIIGKDHHHDRDHRGRGEYGRERRTREREQPTWESAWQQQQQQPLEDRKRLWAEEKRRLWALGYRWVPASGGAPGRWERMHHHVGREPWVVARSPGAHHYATPPIYHPYVAPTYGAYHPYAPHYPYTAQYPYAPYHPYAAPYVAPPYVAPAYVPPTHPQHHHHHHHPHADATAPAPDQDDPDATPPPDAPQDAPPPDPPPDPATATASGAPNRGRPPTAHQRHHDYVFVEGHGWRPQWFPYWEPAWHQYWKSLYDYYGGDANPEYAELARDEALRVIARQRGWL
jgi:hypothetical protein